ncbi:SDR family NAD(P)-dependent oxidoreductase [Xenorhabdus sp. TH1]|uniref:SDR family NAD(P)-dependent oxidoreductase n=1 Tax=Xenorhabdus sp. TH1 TaxID=3130166 RepID=UPI0030D3549F
MDQQTFSVSNECKSILITGASTGLGAQAASYLANRGFTVFAGVRNISNVVPTSTPNIHYIPLDITQIESIDHALSLIKKHDAPPLWAIINNAGICVPSPLEMLPADELRYQLETNVIGQLSITQKVLPLLRYRKGRIINITSGLGNLALPYLGAYSIAQFAKEAFSDVLRRELYNSGVDVIVIQPGAINTPIWDKFLSVGRNIIANANSSLKRIYGRSFQTFLETSPVHAQASPTTPDHFAQVVYLALTDKSPKTRYAVGQDSMDFRTKARTLPTRTVDDELSIVSPRSDEFITEFSTKQTGNYYDKNKME